MFKMNPEAKEFVPAHILKKRQEEADRVSDLTRQLNLVDIKSDGKTKTSETDSNKAKSTDTTVQNEQSQEQNTNDGIKKELPEALTSSGSGKETSHCDENNSRSNGYKETESREGHQDLINDDDRFLLNAGENICEFNGEQFIIPGDDEFEPIGPAGYDFGNDEDNEDEDVCNAFEEFLENLPDQ